MKITNPILKNSAKMLTVLIVLFDQVEVLDAFGPFEVFATVRNDDGELIYRVLTIAEELRPIKAVGGLIVQPHLDIDNAPQACVLVVPGGIGRLEAMNSTRLIKWIGEQSQNTKITMSVCTGSFLLGKAQLLDGLAITTHHSALTELAACFPSSTVEGNRRFIEQGRIVTAAGISAGIDASLHVVELISGHDVANRVAKRMEYPWPQEQGN